jgi:4-hydroxy-tetrahydrodipicolinate synthase
MLTGSLVAIVTPMHPDGSLDLPRLRKLIDFHVDNGTAGIVIVGTTGESPTVSVEEHWELIRTAVQHSAGRVPVIAGTGANSTSEAIEHSRYAKEVGADFGLSVVPYYNKPTQEGLFQHFRKIAEVGLPTIVYNVPSRTVADLATETVLRLAQVPGIVGLKDATGDIPRGSDLLRRVPTGFAVYSGNDDSALALMCMGGQGVISVVANVAPRQMHDMCAAALAGDIGRAREINRSLLSLHTRLFVEANPIPLKWAMTQMGLIENGIRLPLTPLSAQHHETIRAALHEAGVLN